MPNEFEVSQQHQLITLNSHSLKKKAGEKRDSRGKNSLLNPVMVESDQKLVGTPQVGLKTQFCQQKSDITHFKDKVEEVPLEEDKISPKHLVYPEQDAQLL